MSDRKLFPDTLAARIKASGAKHYRPSNGTEGDLFQERWCEHCRHDAFYRRGSGEGCKILGATMAHDVDDPQYPPEWTYDAEGQPCCTAFEPVMP